MVTGAHMVVEHISWCLGGDAGAGISQGLSKRERRTRGAAAAEWCADVRERSRRPWKHGALVCVLVDDDGE